MSKAKFHCEIYLGKNAKKQAIFFTAKHLYKVQFALFDSENLSAGNPEHDQQTTFYVVQFTYKIAPLLPEFVSNLFIV